MEDANDDGSDKSRDLFSTSSMVSLGNRTFNAAHMGPSPSLYSMCGAFVLNDANFLRSKLSDAQQREVDGSSSFTVAGCASNSAPPSIALRSPLRRLPPVQQFAAVDQALAPDARRTVQLKGPILGELTAVPTERILQSHVEYFKNLNKWYRRLSSIRIMERHKFRLDKLNELMNSGTRRCPSSNAQGDVLNTVFKDPDACSSGQSQQHSSADSPVQNKVQVRQPHKRKAGQDTRSSDPHDVPTHKAARSS